MKRLLASIFLLIPLILLGTNYYVNATTGSDGNPGTILLPWSTIAKVNSSMALFNPADSILFNKGDTWYGALTITRNGSSGSPIIFSAYGSGARPVITGFTTVSAWSNLGSNIWESTSAVSALTTCNMVAIGGINTAMGRIPNTSYYTYQSHSGQTSITSSSLTGTPNWTGAEVALRKNHFIIDRSAITAQSAGTLTFTVGSNYAPTDGFGFFIQNDLRTLDTQNEWYYNPSTKKISIYSSSSPTGVRVSTLDTLVYFTGRSYLNFDNISFTGSNKYGFLVNSSNNINIRDCTFDYSGTNAISAASSSKLTIANSSFNHTNNNALSIGDYQQTATNNVLISEDTIRNTGALAGMGKRIDEQTEYTAIFAPGANNTVQKCIIDSTGYIPVWWGGNDYLVDSNFITNFCFIKDDGGATWTWNNGTTPVTYTNQRVLNNIILNGIGALAGSVPNPLVGASGIYCDNNTAGIEINGNSVANCNRHGILLHDAHEITVRNNTMYNNNTQISIYSDNMVTNDGDGVSLIRNLNVKNNIFLSKTTTQYGLSAIITFNDLSSWGAIDSNYHARPINDNLTILADATGGGTSFSSYTLGSWQTYSGYDIHSHKSPRTITDTLDLRFEYNYSPSPSVVSLLPYNYMDVTGATHNGSITVAPYASSALIKNGLAGTTYYVSTTGNDSNPGTIGSPFRTLQKISTISAPPGTIFYIRAGTYNSGVSAATVIDWTIDGFHGTAADPILISAYPPDFLSGGRVVFNCGDVAHPTGNNIGIYVSNCSYLTIRGIRVTGIPQFQAGQVMIGLYLIFGNDITVDNCEADHIGNTGMRLHGVNNATFNNCDVHHLDNPFDPGIQMHGGADGFGRFDISNNSTNTVYRGCRAYWCADDGWDLFNTSGTAIIDSCWSFWNGYIPGGFTTGGDGNGWKLGPSADFPNTVLRTLTNCISFQNRVCGFTQNTARCQMIFYNCVAYANFDKWGFTLNYNNIAHTVKNCIAYNNGVGLGYPEVDLSVATIQSNNTWNSIPASAASFQSLDTTGVTGARQANGSLPNLTFLHLSSTSNLINKGVYVGLPFCGAAPDVGAYEYCPGAPPVPLSAVANNTAIICNGQTSQLTVNAAGGQPPYTYKIGAGSFSSVNSFTVSAGTYLLTVQDALGAQATAQATITQPTQITISQVSGSITVNGATTTTTVTASGGSGSAAQKLYRIDNGGYQASNVFTGVAAGNHTIMVRDSAACTNTLAYTLTQPSVLVVGSSVTTAITCNGGNGVITVTASGGTSPYSNTGAFIRAAGTWSFTVTDGGGASATTTTTITQPSAIAITESHTAIAINGGTSTVTITASGGTGTLNYKIGSGSYQVSNVFSGVSAGTYTVTVRDANSCTNAITFTITQPTALLVSAAVTTAIACNNGTATATVTASGGTPSYQYKVGAGSYQASAVFSGLVAGSYTFTVLDAGGALVSTPLTITQPTQISVSSSFGTAPATVTVTASGGVGTLNYKIDAGSYQVSNVFSAVAAGNHTITVRDANLCTNSQAINVPTAGTPLAITATPTNATCNGGNGSVLIGASGGTAPYSGTGTFAQAAGTTSYTVTDNVGATKSTTVTITQPAAIAIAAPSYAAIAANGGSTTVTITASAGVPAYQYNLDGGGYQVSNSFAGVLAGNHSIVVRDANLCTSTLLFTITQPGILYISVSPTAITCYGGNSTVTITGSGGTAPIAVTGGSPQTKTAGSYTFRVTDAFGTVHDSIVTISQPTQISIAVTTGTILTNGGNTTVTATASGGTGALSYKIDGGSYQGTGSFSGITAGTHTVTVRDASLCTNTNTFSITQPGQLYISISRGTAITCYGGTQTITITGSGGTAPLSVTGGSPQSKLAGTYTMTVTDAFGATADTIISVTQPTQIFISNVAVGTITTPGGTTTADVIAAGGTGTLNYKLDGGSYQSSSSFTGVTGGNHTMTVRDANLCTNTYTFNVYQPPTQSYYKRIRRSKTRYIKTN